MTGLKERCLEGVYEFTERVGLEGPWIMVIKAGIELNEDRITPEIFYDAMIRAGIPKKEVEEKLGRYK